MGEQTILCWNLKVTVADYNEMEGKKDRDQIAKFISERFTERYVTPLTGDHQKSGFCTMAVCCLMIEALESFRRGWRRTPGDGSELAFCSFFNAHENLKDFRGNAEDFYKHVRCGLLHQGETTGGWQITRLKGLPLFDSNRKTVHATKFHNELKRCLDHYCAALKLEAWNSELWTKLRRKMKQVCKNCERV